MGTTAQREHAVPWPLARRVAVGLAQPGGPAMVRRAVEGLGLEPGDRVVELAPGLGATTAILLEREPREWTGVEADPIAAEHLERTIAGPGRDVVPAPADATGLADAAASVVVADALLSTLEDAEVAAVLAEARRLLRPGGRVAIHELAPADGPADPEAVDDLRAAGLRPRPVEAWRALAADAGFVVIGSLAGRLALPAPRGLLRELGPRGALQITREIARDGALRSAVTSARQALERRALSLRAALVVAEVPLILGLRRPRR
jgi:SAM-dependent methyltransferase